jgi:hypothetical protein
MKTKPKNPGGQQDSEQQAEPGHKQSNDLSGGYPRSPGGANQLSADEDMDEDTGLSNRENRQAPIDQGSRQASQSNVGRRDDGTPD